MRDYAIEERTGQRVLLRFRCDARECDRSVKPHPEIAESGWRKRGERDEGGNAMEWDYCPDHAHLADEPSRARE